MSKKEKKKDTLDLSWAKAPTKDRKKLGLEK